ncbi:hypothetical protein B0H67DRAFT_569373 [Lasiosphaeris hirsuta]|uniref:Secreted protein n=1 Tax=Lasiosphaeris hirsuta TaxID=260670 RepID=A0AA40E2V9_9PEZI|nr:hypothetical protein B0H67DRAFT_569373 [Lasiosphaeris hirsuta]
MPWGASAGVFIPIHVPCVSLCAPCCPPRLKRVSALPTMQFLCSLPMRSPGRAPHHHAFSPESYLRGACEGMQGGMVERQKQAGRERGEVWDRHERDR